MPKFNVLLLLSLTHVIANRLNSKHRRHAVMAEWLTAPTKVRKEHGSSLSAPSPQY